MKTSMKNPLFVDKVEGKMAITCDSDCVSKYKFTYILVFAHTYVLLYCQAHTYVLLYCQTLHYHQALFGYQKNLLFPCLCNKIYRMEDRSEI